MSNEQLCISCGKPITPDEPGVICDTCGRTSHLHCWQTRGGCSTEGCSGRILSMISGTAAAAPIPSAVPTPLPTVEKPKKKKHTGLIITLIAIAVVLVAGLVCGGIFVGIPYLKYNKALDAMNAGKYDDAYSQFYALNGFSDSADMALEAIYRQGKEALKDQDYDFAYNNFIWLGDYSDSAKMANQSLYSKGKSLMDKGKYDEAKAEFERLGDYKDAAELIQEALYLKAQKASDDKAYKDAYILYTELGNYKESAAKRQTAMILWEAQALNNTYKNEAVIFLNTVDLTSADYNLFYSTLVLFVTGHEDVDYWVNSERFENVYTLLSMLPRNYEETQLLWDLFSVLKEYNHFVVSPRVLYRDHADLMAESWNIPFVQNMAKDDLALGFFLEGKWTGSGYYFSIDSEGYSKFDLPWVAKPSGTQHYALEDLIYSWRDGNNKRLANVFRFEILDYETINVYCYENGRTYTMYRN